MMVQGKLAANSLVRYRGMVQDQYEPEYFVGSFEEVETATGQRSRVDVKYVDSIAQRPGYLNEYDGPGAKTMDRYNLCRYRVVHCTVSLSHVFSVNCRPHAPPCRQRGRFFFTWCHRGVLLSFSSLHV